MIGIIGCGNMGEAIISGLKSKKKAKLIVYDTAKAKLSKINARYKVRAASSLKELISHSKTIIIAVKPQDINTILKSLRFHCSNQLLISIAAGISTSFIEKAIKKRARIIRAMPNLAAKVSMSITALAKGKYATRNDLLTAQRIFKTVGSTLAVKEGSIDAITAISGSGPGYIYNFLNRMEEAAVKLGFSKKDAHALVFHTAKGAMKLVSGTDDFGKLTRQVASKDGTTEAALKIFKKHRLKRIVEEATGNAKRQAKKLSK